MSVHTLAGIAQCITLCGSLFGRWQAMARSMGCAGLVTMLGVMSGGAVAQVLQLSTAQTKVARLASDASSTSLTFKVDGSARIVLVNIKSTLPDLVTSVVLPGGVVVSEGSVSGIGGNFMKAAGEASALSVYPFSGVGTHFIYRIPVAVGGTLVVNLGTSTVPTRDEAVIVALQSDSSIGATAFFTEPSALVGRPAVLTAIVRDRTAAVTGATVVATLMRGALSTEVLTLRDDGQNADAMAGDGVYTVVVVPGAVGKFIAMVDISGTSAGQAFDRQAAAALEAVAVSGTLLGTVRGRGVDLNANGALDRIAVDADVNVSVAGRYRLFVRLATAGRQMVASGDADLTVGARVMTVLFDTQALVAAGLGKGPYNMELVELGFVETKEIRPADRRINAGSLDFSNVAFERLALQLTGVSSDTGFDSNGNGLFDELRVTLQVDALAAGNFNFSGRLADDFGTQIALYASSANLVAGLNNIVFRFSGPAIGGRGISGPFALDSVLITDNSARSLSNPAAAARTQAYSYKQFEGASRQVADLNDDGRLNCQDVAIVRASFGRRRGQAGFNARADINADGVVSVLDLAVVTRALPVGLSCPG